MSGFFGIFNRNENPFDKNIADDMLESISYWDPDERDLWIDGPVVLGHTMLWNTPESKYEHLPLQKEKDTYALTMDARIDNRDELAKELRLPNRPINEIGDSEFILAAYQKWGEECPKHLLGDFAFAIWDKKKEQLFCARDHIGIKSLYYYIDSNMFVFSNDIYGILSHPNVSKDFDEKSIAIFLTGEPVRSKRTTFFEKIKKLPAAKTLTVSISNFKENSYWDIKKCPSIYYDTYEEYVNKLKELYESTVEVRLRSNYPIASHLSGGIDCSSIAVSAAQKLKKKHQKLYAFNWINIPKNDDEYEYEAWNFSRRIADNEENIIHEEFSIDPYFMVKQYKEHNILTKGTMYYWWEYYVQNSVKDIGARTLLSGWGGDELISDNGYSYISGLFRQGKIVKAFKYLHDEKKSLRYSWTKFIKRTVREIFPFTIIQYFKTVIHHQNIKVKYIKKEFVRSFNGYNNKGYPNVYGVRKNKLASYNYGHLQHRIESWDLSTFSNKIEYRYPLLDKRIVEFAMGIPEEIFYPKEGKSRHLFKNAVSDLLPYDIVWFEKPHEIKVNKTMRNYYYESLKIVQKKFKNEDCKLYDCKYIDCNELKVSLELLDFTNLDTISEDNILACIILLNSIKNMRLKIDS